MTCISREPGTKYVEYHTLKRRMKGYPPNGGYFVLGFCLRDGRHLIHLLRNGVLYFVIFNT